MLLFCRLSILGTHTSRCIHLFVGNIFENMKLNENVVLTGNLTILIPYEAKHVLRYHEWMQSPELQELTCSEALSLEKEYEMQRTWREDEDKLTFLILNKAKFDTTSDEIESLVGDINIFYDKDEKVAEISLMIASPEDRRKGFGVEAALQMIRYACEVEILGIKVVEAKIGDSNKASIAMFKNKLGFKRKSHSACFKEETLMVEVTEEYKEWLKSMVNTQQEVYT